VAGEMQEKLFLGEEDSGIGLICRTAKLIAEQASIELFIDCA
jgi:hypothetical protein